MPQTARYIGVFFILAFLLYAGLSHAQTNASVSRNGQPSPTSSTQLGCVDGSGNLQPASAAAPCPVTATISGNTPTYPAGTATTLDIKTVTTGGTAVNALSAGHCKYGCALFNPTNAGANLCGNEFGTASTAGGYVTNGDTWCVAAGLAINFLPTANAISVVSSDSSHPFGCAGTQ